MMFYCIVITIRICDIYGGIMKKSLLGCLLVIAGLGAAQAEDVRITPLPSKYIKLAEQVGEQRCYNQSGQLVYIAGAHWENEGENHGAFGINGKAVEMNASQKNANLYRYRGKTIVVSAKSLNMAYPNPCSGKIEKFMMSGVAGKCRYQGISCSYSPKAKIPLPACSSEGIIKTPTETVPVTCVDQRS